MIYIGIDPGVKTGGVHGINHPLVTSDPVWRSWGGQHAVMENLYTATGCLSPREPIVFQCEGAFLKAVLNPHTKRPMVSKAKGAMDVILSIGAWWSLAERIGARWCEPVLWSTWAPAMSGVRKGKMTLDEYHDAMEKALWLCHQSLGFERKGTPEHLRDARLIRQWRIEQDKVEKP